MTAIRSKKTSVYYTVCNSLAKYAFLLLFAKLISVKHFISSKVDLPRNEQASGQVIEFVAVRKVRTYKADRRTKRSWLTISIKRYQFPEGERDLRSKQQQQQQQPKTAATLFARPDGYMIMIKKSP